MLGANSALLFVSCVQRTKHRYLYIGNCVSGMEPSKTKDETCWPRGFVCLLHDNARPHVARDTKALLDRFGWDVISHTPYSPDLAPTDYHLFLNLKEHLGGKRMETDEEVKKVIKFLKNWPTETPSMPWKVHPTEWRLCRKIIYIYPIYMLM